MPARTKLVSPIAALLVAIALGTSAAQAEDGGNDVCPATGSEADDVRQIYDTEGRLLEELRLRHGELVEEIDIAYAGGHAVTRTESSAGHRRVARNQFAGDDLSAAECYVDDALTGRATYHYEDGHLSSVEKESPLGSIVTSRFFYDSDGNLIANETRDSDGNLLSSTHAVRPPPRTPIHLAFTAGGSYQSDTELYDATAGLSIHRKPAVERYGSDPLEAELDAVYKFHRATGITTTDQTTARLGVDYHDILPRLTLFTFTSTDRNIPANLKLNLEEAVLGVKVDIVPRRTWQLDASFAPVWNLRSISTPASGAAAGAPLVDETTSKVRGSFRLRAGIHRPTWSLLDTFEFLPTLFGDDNQDETTFWDRTVARDTVTLDVELTHHLSFREEFKYTRDPAMRAQAACPDGSNPLCRGYSLASTTAIVLNLDL